MNGIQDETSSSVQLVINSYDKQHHYFPIRFSLSNFVLMFNRSFMKLPVSFTGRGFQIAETVNITCLAP